LRRYEKKQQIEVIWQENYQSELKDSLRESLREAALTGVKACLEEALQQELKEHLGFEPYQRGQKGAKPAEAQRSGYFKRRVISDHGEIPDLRVPKLRRGNKDREWQVLSRYQRCLSYVLNGLMYLYVMGLSLRDLQEALYVQFGSLLSVSAINQITLHIQQEIEDWHQLKLKETPPIILVDGVWVKILYPTGEVWVDQAGHKRQQQQGQERVILAAMAVWPDGSYHLLHYEVAEGENESTWKAFWQHLLARGLDPLALKMVVSDGTKGLLEALSLHLPHTKLQRCTVHKVRGLERYLQYNHLPQTDPDTQQTLTTAEAKAQRKLKICQDAHHIFKATTRAEAQDRLSCFIEKWSLLEPKAVKNFKWGLKRCFVFYDFDPSLYHLIHSTNLLERFFREFRAKSDEIGSFPNETSCLTIFQLVMLRDHAKHNRLIFAKNSRH
jgi:transposase-like protein